MPQAVRHFCGVLTNHTNSHDVVLKLTYTDIINISTVLYEIYVRYNQELFGMHASTTFILITSLRQQYFSIYCQVLRKLGFGKPIYIYVLRQFPMIRDVV